MPCIGPLITINRGLVEMGVPRILCQPRCLGEPRVTPDPAKVPGPPMHPGRLYRAA